MAYSMSSTTNEETPPSVPSSRRRSLFFSRQFNASLLTIGSINTILPQYSATDADEQPHTSPELDDGSDGTFQAQNRHYASPPPFDPSSSAPGRPLSPPGSPLTPSRLSVINPRHSTLLAWTTSSIPSFNDSLQTDSFRYSYPIPSNKHWAILHLSTCKTIAGNPRPSHTQPKLPRYWGCDPVSGVVQLDLDHPLTIQQINVTVRFYLPLSIHLY